MRDRYTGTHCEAVVSLAIAVADDLGLDASRLRELEYAARLHDVGKVGIPDAILHKPGPLDDDEWSVMRCHPQWGAEVLGGIPELQGVAEVIRAEHEHWDGRGYPNELAAEEIPLASRIILACDAYHAMTSDRPYRRAMSRVRARAELQHAAGSQFDPVVVDALVDHVPA
jgi:HD-GYP domain-containing protein (c-di-GMP phosphodiesterase class II)